MSEWDDISVADSGSWDDISTVGDSTPTAIADTPVATATVEPEQSGDGWDEMYASIKANEEEAARLGISVYELNLQKGAAAEQENNPKSAVRRIAETGVDAFTGVVVDPLLKVEGMLGSETADIARGNRQFQQDVRGLQSSGWLESTISGVVDSVATSATAASLGGLPAILGTIGNKSYDQAFRQARRGGANESEARKIAMANGAIEVGVTAAFQMAGLGGLEQQVLNGAKWKGVKALAKQVAAEVTEEEITTLGQNLASRGDVGKPQDYVDTAIQSILAMGVVGGSQKAINFVNSPSRSNARKLGLGETSAKEREAIAERAQEIIQPVQEQQVGANKLQETLNRAMPESGGIVTPRKEGGFRIEFGDRGSVELWEVDAIAPGSQGQEAFFQKNLQAYGMKDTPENRQLISDAEGAYYMRLPSGQSIDGLGIISLKRGASREADSILRHELIHMMVDNGIVSDADLILWAKANKMEGATKAQLSEALAQKGTDWGGIGTRIENFFKAILEAIGLSDAQVRKLEAKIFSGEAVRGQRTAALPADPQTQAEYDADYAPQEPQDAPPAPDPTPIPSVESESPQPEVAPETPTGPPDGPPEPPSQPPMSDGERAPGTYSPRHAWMREDAEKILGVTIDPQLSRTWEESFGSAVSDGIPDVAVDLSESVVSEARPLSDKEEAGIMLRYVDSIEQLGKLEEQIKQAKDPAIQGHMVATRNKLRGELETMAIAMDYGGSELGRALNLRKSILNRDGDLFTNLADARASKGDELTSKEKANVEKKVNKRDRLKKAVAKAEDAAKKKQHREVARLKSAISNIRQQIGLDPQKLGNVDVPGLTAAEQAKVIALRTKLDQAEAALTKMDKLPLLESVHNRPSEKIISDLDDAISKVRAIISSKRPKVVKVPTDAEVEQRKVKSLESQLAKIEEQLASSDTTQQDYHDVASKRRTELRAELKEARKKLREKQPPLSSYTEIRKIKAIERSLEKAQKDIENARKGILPQKKPKVVDAASERRTFLNTQLKNARQELRETIAGLKPRQPWDYVVLATDFIRNVKGGVDFSAIRRQGALLAGRPSIVFKMANAGFNAAKNDYAFERHFRSIMDRDNAIDYERTPLAIQDLDTPTAEKDEFMNSFLVKKIPLLRGSQRAFIAAINEGRADIYDIMKARRGGDGNLTWENKRALAHTANVLTGRGDWKRLDSSMHTLSTWFWAPRLYLSRVQALFGQPIWNAPKEDRMVIGTEMARGVAGVLSIFALYIGAAAMREFARNDEVEWDYIIDPRHPAFGKIRVGDTYIDPTGGISQFVRFFSQLGTGEQVNDKGEVLELSPYQKRANITRMLQSKLAPGPGLALDLTTGQNYVGDPMNFTSFEGAVNILTNTILPLSLSGPLEAAIGAVVPEELRGELGKEIRLQLEQLGVPETIFLNLFAEPAGEGVTTYQKEDKSKRTSRPTRPQRPSRPTRQ